MSFADECRVTGGVNVLSGSIHRKTNDSLLPITHLMIVRRYSMSEKPPVSLQIFKFT